MCSALWAPSARASRKVKGSEVKGSKLKGRPLSVIIMMKATARKGVAHKSYQVVSLEASDALELMLAKSHVASLGEELSLTGEKCSGSSETHIIIKLFFNQFL